MRTVKPGNIALLLATVLTSITVVLFFIVVNSKVSTIWQVLVPAVLSLFLIEYFIIRYYLQRFIYEKIKLIYKSIHSLKLSKEEKKEIPLYNDNVFEEVNQEVETWATERASEIDALRKQEIYRREFLGNVSHELKTPLSNIQGFALTLIDGGLEDPQINLDYLRKIQRNTERMITIVQDLEVISKLESGEAKPEIARFDIVALVRDVFEFLESKARLKSIALVLADVDTPPVYVMADKEKIRQVLVNIIDNSIKYGRDNGRTKVSFYDMDENLLVEISDNGFGIEDKHLPHLFERFYRVDKHRSRSGGGSGLGLAIVKHIIEAHSQTINVRSAPGVGSTFSFTIALE